MEIRDSKGTVYPVSYTMTNLAGGWKVRNVIISSINIGKLFRDQFADTMQKNRNDLEEDHRRLGRGGRQGRKPRKQEEGRGEMSQASLRGQRPANCSSPACSTTASGPALREASSRLIRASQARNWSSTARRWSAPAWAFPCCWPSCATHARPARS